MNSAMVSIRSYLEDTKAGAVEFVLIFPFLFFVLTMVLDAGNFFADRRVAYRVAESIVRTARNIERPIVTGDILPLQSDQITLLRNMARRLKIQFPEEDYYVWLGRYVRPQSNNNLSYNPVRQLLPDGLTSYNNRGIALLGVPDHANDINAKMSAQIEAFALPGEIVYAVEIAFTRRFITPLPRWARQRLTVVRYVL